MLNVNLAYKRFLLLRNCFVGDKICAQHIYKCKFLFRFGRCVFVISFVESKFLDFFYECCILANKLQKKLHFVCNDIYFLSKQNNDMSAK